MPLGSSFICIYNTPAHPPRPTECPESIFFAARCRLALAAAAAAAYKSRRAFSNTGQSSISFSPLSFFLSRVLFRLSFRLPLPPPPHTIRSASNLVMSLPHPHHEHEHNYEVALPAVLPDVDIEDAPPSPPIHLARRSTRRSSMRQSISSPAARPHYSSTDSAETVTEPDTVHVAASGPGKLDPEKALEKWEVVDWEVGDPEDPRNFSKTKKW